MSAVLVAPSTADRETWLAARRKGIGASDIAAVLGISPWQSAFSLYWEKVEGWTGGDTPNAEAGRRMEGAIADWFADVADPLSNLAVRPGGLYASIDRPWQLATPDRLIHLPCGECDATGIDDLCAVEPVTCWHCRGVGVTGDPVAVLECKHPYDWHGFGEDGTDDIPVHYRAQVLWQCDVVGVDEWYLAAYASHEFRIYRGRRDDKDLRVMREAGARFWSDVQARRPPELDAHTATLATLKRLHPTVEDRDVEVPHELATAYHRARRLRDRAADVVDRCENRLRGAMGSARRAVCDGKTVVTRSVFERSGEDSDLHALDEGRPITDRLNPSRRFL